MTPGLDVWITTSHLLAVLSISTLAIPAFFKFFSKYLRISISLDKILEKYLKIDKVELIKCGNGNRIAAEREQWSDGVNTLCIRPGVVITYDRNYVTNKTLRDHGIKVIEIPSCELSRGRGGPHCMSMALVREDL